MRYENYILYRSTSKKREKRSGVKLGEGKMRTISTHAPGNGFPLSLPEEKVMKDQLGELLEQKKQRVC